MTILDHDLYDDARRDDSPAQNAARDLISWANTTPYNDQTRSQLHAMASVIDEKRVMTVELPSDPASSAPAVVEVTVDELSASTEAARLVIETSLENRLTVDLEPTSRLASLARRIAEGA